MHRWQRKPTDGPKGGRCFEFFFPLSLSLHLSVCLSVSISLSISLYFSLFLSISQAICYLSVCLSIYLSRYLSLSLSLSLALALSLSLSLYIHPSIHPSIHPLHFSIHPSTAFFYPSIYCIYLSIYLSIYPKGNNSARLPAKVEVDRFKTKEFCERFPKNKGSQLQNDDCSHRCCCICTWEIWLLSFLRPLLSHEYLMIVTIRPYQKDENTILSPISIPMRFKDQWDIRWFYRVPWDMSGIRWFFSTPLANVRCIPQKPERLGASPFLIMGEVSSINISQYWWLSLW